MRRFELAVGRPAADGGRPAPARGHRAPGHHPQPQAALRGRRLPAAAGVAALRPELTALAALHPDGTLGEQFSRARTATEQELAALESSLKGLKAGNDAVVAIKTLQAQLVPLERRATAAWLALKIPACVDI